MSNMTNEQRLKQKCIDRIDSEKSLWSQAKKYAGRLKSGINSLQDLNAALNIANEHMKQLNIPPRDVVGVKVVARAVKMVRKIADVLIEQGLEEQRLYLDRSDDYARYRYECRFKITATNISLIKGYDLLLNRGVYSTANTAGVVKDHMISVKYGFDNKIDPLVIGHISNCQFISYAENAKKSSNCSRSLDSLLEEIRSH